MKPCLYEEEDTLLISYTMERHSNINGCDNYDNHSISPLCKTLFNLLTLKPTVMQIDIHSCHAWPLPFSCCHHGDVTWGNSFVFISWSNRASSKAAHCYCCFICLFVCLRSIYVSSSRSSLFYAWYDWRAGDVICQLSSSVVSAEP